ncbi:MAG TPA: hypothetical protein PLM72_07410 [Spirochaetota bacterium]|nr:hypothetical protein [Spirochaetota bacterium]
MADPVITAAEVIAYNEMAADTSTASIDLRIPLAQSFVNDQLNNEYDSTAHGKTNEYKAAVMTYAYYLYIDRLNLVSLIGIGQLKENTVDKVYVTQNEIRQKKEDLLKETMSWIDIVRKAMTEIDEDILDESSNTMNVGGSITIIGCGNNPDYKTNYGLVCNKMMMI